MMRTQDSSQSPVKITGVWTVKERVNGLWVVRKTVKNRFTNYGTTALASALGGAYTPPQWIALESFYTTPFVQGNIGDTQIILNARADISGDTQLVLGVGGGSQEVVTFSGVTGSGPYIYALSTPLVFTHTTTDICVRQVEPGDTLSNVTTEIQYDSTNFPGQRMQSPGGYSAGIGNFTVQFYFPGGTATGWIITCGLVDNVSIGAGNLHNHFILGFNNNNPANDLEIDGSITLTN